MNRVDPLISALVDAAEHPAATVKASMQATGKQAVGCFPCYTPDEIIHAAGLLPVGLWGGKTAVKRADRYLQSFCCSMMRINLEQGLAGAYDFLSGVVIPTYCDTLKCVCANWPVAVPQIRLIPMVYPQNRAASAAMDYLVGEFRRVQTELEEIAGRTIGDADLEASITLFETYRDTMRRFSTLAGRYPLTLDARTRHAIVKAGYFMDKAAYVDTVNALIQALTQLPEESSNDIKVVVTGILAEPDGLLDAFVENRMVIVADDLAQESRQFRTPARPDGPLLARLAGRILDQEGCPLLFDAAKKRGQLLIDLVRANAAAGVVVLMMKFCDPEEFDYPIYKKELDAAGIPVLYLEIEQKMDSVAQIQTRIQSFAEMIG